MVAVRRIIVYRKAISDTLCPSTLFGSVRHTIVEKADDHVIIGFPRNWLRNEALLSVTATRSHEHTVYDFRGWASSRSLLATAKNLIEHTEKIFAETHGDPISVASYCEKCHYPLVSFASFRCPECGYDNGERTLEWLETESAGHKSSKAPVVIFLSLPLLYAFGRSAANDVSVLTYLPHVLIMYFVAFLYILFIIFDAHVTFRDKFKRAALSSEEVKPGSSLIP